MKFTGEARDAAASQYPTAEKAHIPICDPNRAGEAAGEVFQKIYGRAI